MRLEQGGERRRGAGAERDGARSRARSLSTARARRCGTPRARRIRDHARAPLRLGIAWLPALLALGCITVNLPSGELEPLAETVIDGEGDPKVLMLEIDGVITETSDVADCFGTVERENGRRACARSSTARATTTRCKALVLRINSPGGTVTASDLLYDEIRALQAGAQGARWSRSCMGIAASGGYYVALAADEIHAAARRR